MNIKNLAFCVLLFLDMNVQAFGDFSWASSARQRRKSVADPLKGKPCADEQTLEERAQLREENQRLKKEAQHYKTQLKGCAQAYQKMQEDKKLLYAAMATGALAIVSAIWNVVRTTK